MSTFAPVPAGQGSTPSASTAPSTGSQPPSDASSPEGQPYDSEPFISPEDPSSTWDSQDPNLPKDAVPLAKFYEDATEGS
jgi:hypothetical protein